MQYDKEGEKVMDIDIQHIAKLARLKLDENKVGMFSEQMKSIIAMVDGLPVIEADDAKPDEKLVMLLREDVVQASMKREEILSNAPQTSAGCVVVPRILD